MIDGIPNRPVYLSLRTLLYIYICNLTGNFIYIYIYIFDFICIRVYCYICIESIYSLNQYEFLFI